eukprot:m.123190 g.123190  ORF g.123190 m.123190 type:complete len:93 (+) comp12943_c0_seq12:1587-1865(+)
MDKTKMCLEWPFSMRQKHKHATMAHFLLLNNASRDACDNHDNTVLHVAASKGDFSTVCVLVKFGIDVKSVNEDGKVGKRNAYFQYQVHFLKE